MAWSWQMMTSGPFCGRCGVTSRDPFVPSRCGGCGAPIKAPFGHRVRAFRREMVLGGTFFALFVVALWSLGPT